MSSLTDGLPRAGEIVELAAQEGLDLACAVVLLQKESGGRNVWGHDPVDTGGVYVKGSEVTREAYLEYKRRNLPAQGVGPCQLTYKPFQQQADDIGGCWDWRCNVTIGFRILAGYIKRYGEREAFRRYNGSGPAAERYADDAMARLKKLRGSAATVTPAAVKTTGTLLKRGSTGEEVRRLQTVLNRNYPLYSKLVVDGIFGPATEKVVKEFQRRAGLVVDGIVGPATRAKLGL